MSKGDLQGSLDLEKIKISSPMGSMTVQRNIPFQSEQYVKPSYSQRCKINPLYLCSNLADKEGQG